MMQVKLYISRVIRLDEPTDPRLSPNNLGLTFVVYGQNSDTNQGHFAKVVTSNQCTISNTILEHNYVHLVSTLKVLKIKLAELWGNYKRTLRRWESFQL